MSLVKEDNTFENTRMYSVFPYWQKVKNTGYEIGWGMGI